MCLAKLYPPGENNKPALENITALTIDQGQISVETLFGEKKVFRGRIGRIDFAESKIHLKAAEKTIKK